MYKQRAENVLFSLNKVKFKVNVCLSYDQMEYVVICLVSLDSNKLEYAVSNYVC